MDTELAERLSDLKSSMARIDERTIAIHESQEGLKNTFQRHETQDRMDFKEVHSRVTRVDRKQNWMLGVGTAVVAIVLATVKGMFGG